MFKAIRKLFSKGELECADVADLSSDYIDNNLKVEKRSAFQSHLSKCGPCQAFVDTLSSTINALSKLPGVNTPSTLKQSIMDKARRDN